MWENACPLPPSLPHLSCKPSTFSCFCQVPCIDAHSGPFSEELEQEQAAAARTAAVEAAVLASLVVGIVLLGAAWQSAVCRRAAGPVVDCAGRVLSAGSRVVWGRGRAGADRPTAARYGPVHGQEF